MSEDVSATMRVGVTVILVAALVAVVLNLMVMSQSILSNGQATLQSGIDQVSKQEFATYDNKKVSGTLVQTALSLYQGRDIAIVIQTKSLRETTGWSGAACNYNSILCAGSNNANIGAEKVEKSDSGDVATTVTGNAYKVTVGNNESNSLYQKGGESMYTGQLFVQNGLVQNNSETLGTATIGNPQYLLSSARFQSTLIKDKTGNIIGIFFKQVD